MQGHNTVGSDRSQQRLHWICAGKLLTGVHVPNPVWDAPKVPHPSCLRVLTLCWLAFPRRRRSACVNIGVIQVKGKAGWEGLCQGGPPHQVTLQWDLTTSRVGWKEKRGHLFWQVGLPTKLTSLRAPPG